MTSKTSSNNKRLGTAFEQRVCKDLAKKGYWVHFNAPDSRGAQPFDILAVKDGFAAAIECKTLSTTKKYFTIDRMEENEMLAFDKWLECGNIMPLIFVEYGTHIKVIEWLELKEKKRIAMQ